MSVSSNYTYGDIDNPYNDFMERGGASDSSETNSGDVLYTASTGESSESSTPSTGNSASNYNITSENQIAENAISGSQLTDVWINTWIKSVNYDPKARGFLIDGTRGYIECRDFYSNNAVISGTITAVTGSIGGWTIAANEFYSGGVRIQSNSQRILMGLATAPMTGVGIFMGLDGSDYEFRVGDPGSDYFAYDGSTLTLNGATVSASVFSDIQPGTDISIQGWQNTCVFSATDFDTVAWTSGTITLMTGTTYAISAGNTGNMIAPTYIYLDILVSTTVLQTTTTAANAVGANKILVAVATLNADNTSYATFQVFGGSGGVLLAVDNLAANSLSTNEFISNTAQIKDLIVTNAKINDLVVDKLTTGTISSQQITLGVTAGVGDVYIGAGTFDPSSWTATNGFLLGIDDSDSDKSKFYIGNTTNWMDWNVTVPNQLTINGTFAVGSFPALPNDADMVGYWNFDEGAGTLAVDYSKTNQSLSITNATYSDGISGKCLSFDGSGDYATSGFITVGSSRSVSLWLYKNVNASIQVPFNLGHTDGTATKDVMVLSIDASNVLSLTVGNGSTSATSTASINNSTWYHIAGVYDGTNVTLYVDAIPDSTPGTIASGLTTGNILSIGAYRNNDQYFFDGFIDEVRIYDKALSINEIKALLLNPSGIKQAGVKQLGGSYASSATGIRIDGVNEQLLIGGATAFMTGTGIFLGKDTLYKFRLGDPTDYSKLIYWDGTDLYVNGSTISNTPIFGNGADGDVTISADTSLVRDMYYNNLTVDSGKTLNCAGYRIFVKGTLTNNGTIQRTPNNGGNGGNGNTTPSSAGGGTAGSAAAVLSGANLAGGVAGKAGGVGGSGVNTRVNISSNNNGNVGNPGNNGDNITTGVGSNGLTGQTGGQGGQNGNGWAGGTGGTGGTAGTITTKKYPYSFPEAVQMLDMIAGSSPVIHNSSAGTGGSGGGGSGAGVNGTGESGYTGSGGGGGGSGSAGGIVVCCAREIVNNGSIIAIGGNGGNGGNGANCSVSSGFSFPLYGGGGGGGAGGTGGSGGVLTIIYNKMTNTGTYGAPGGNGGTGGSGGAPGGLGGTAGAAGPAGGTGNTGTLIELQN
jgi:hypothetical protein